MSIREPWDYCDYDDEQIEDDEQMSDEDALEYKADMERSLRIEEPEYFEEDD